MNLITWFYKRLTLELNKNYNCFLLSDESDQWGNIVNGVDLKRYSSKEVYGLTTPLITLASGTKMGKQKVVLSG